jgi:hypothetical protein
MLPMHVVEARADHLEQGTPYYVLSDIIKVQHSQKPTAAATVMVTAVVDAADADVSV